MSETSVSGQSLSNQNLCDQHWIPLESNPDVLNKYVRALGVPENWQFVDIYGLDDDLLAMVPQPVSAVILLFPDTDKVAANPIGSVDFSPPAPLYYMKQSIGNACGTVGIVHAIANSAEKINFDKNKHFIKYLEVTKPMSPEARAKALEEDKKMGSTHQESAHVGQTRAPREEDEVDSHFVAFVHRDGGLYELDGEKEGPVKHGETTQEKLLQDTVKVVREFMKRDPDEITFNMMALVEMKD